MTLSLFSRRILPLATAAVLVCSAPYGALAQNAALGNISGTVRDQTGAVVPGISVTVINTQTGAKRMLTTDSEGHYAAEFLQPGTYEVMSGGGNFGQADRRAIPVTVGAPTSIDLTLPLSSVTTSVEVSSEPPLLDTEKLEQSQVVDQELVSNVPVNSRRFESFVC